MKVSNRLPPVGHFHVVFTVPESLARLMKLNQRALLSVLFTSMSDTLRQFLRNNWKCQGGFMAVLHTWGQTLQWHPHLHVLVSAGGISTTTGEWKRQRGSYLFSVKALAKVYRAVFLKRLRECEGAEDLHWPQDLSSGHARESWRRDLATQQWIVFAKPTLHYTRAVVRYLARYTSRAVISNQRLQEVDLARRVIRISYCDNRRGGTRATLTLSPHQFVARFAQHVLPKGFQRIRYYGVLHPSTTAAAKMPAASYPLPSATPSRRCTRCRASNWTTRPAPRNVLSNGNGARSPHSTEDGSRSSSVRNRKSLLRPRSPTKKSNKTSESMPHTLLARSSIDSGTTQL